MELCYGQGSLHNSPEARDVIPAKLTDLFARHSMRQGELERCSFVRLFICSVQHENVQFWDRGRLAELASEVEGFTIPCWCFTGCFLHLEGRHHVAVFSSDLALE